MKFFFFIFIYLAVQLYFFFTKEKISIFEVQEKALYSIATDYKGFITRDEQIVTLILEVLSICALLYSFKSASVIALIS